MALEPKSPSSHNVMQNFLLKGSLSHKKSESDSDYTERPSKRLKRVETETAADPRPAKQISPSKLSRRIKTVADSDAESGDDAIDNDYEPSTSQITDLEQALPAIKTDKDAIHEYEALRAAENASDRSNRLGQKEWVKGKSSIYVDAFNLALETVLEQESHLFDEAEMAVFRDWRQLSYEAQYLYVRLFLRKTSAWHRISRLGYYNDIGDLEAAVQELFRTMPLPPSSKNAQITPGERVAPEGSELGQDSYTLADDSAEHINSLEEASSLLLLDELKVIAKEAKVEGKNKTELLKALRRTSGKQTALTFAGLQRSETEESVGTSTEVDREDSPLKQDAVGNRDTHFLRKIRAETGPCIRLSLPPFKLFERVHLVFYRSTEWTEKSLTTIILAQIARRNFPAYIVSRSGNIFPSRSSLLEFEASLRTQFFIDNILEFNGPPNKEKLQMILDIFEDVHPRWKTLLEEEQLKEDSIYFSGEGAYLRRLSPAWVYTRIVHKGAYVLGLGKFKQHLREHTTLSELLDQRLFHAARRGAWYQRKALLEEHYMWDLGPDEGRSTEEQKKHWKRVSLRTCEQGLEDNLVHIIYHYDLQKRVTKLEKSLKIAKRHQHDFGHSRLSKPTELTIYGVRLEKTQPLPSLIRLNSAATDTKDLPPLRRTSGKTIWLDPAPDNMNARINVESFALSHYRSEGWKGYHSEGGIVRTLFALLLHPTLFTYVPNVFQTHYQTCPLDLHTDAFYPARLAEINARLALVSNGQAEQMIRETWEAEEPTRTCIVGLDWTFELEDLCEIARCFRGESLAVLCQVMAQEYAQRGGGVPDLFLWRPAQNNGDTDKKLQGDVKFVEVKSENDRLSDTQRLWIHVLAGAGIKVEVCHVLASEVRAIE